MSVSHHAPSQMAALDADIRGLRGRVPLCEDDHTVREALAAAHLANMAALAMAYGDPVVVERLSLPDVTNGNSDPRQVYDAIGLLKYNCVSDAGRDFLPAQDRAVLNQVQADIARHFMEAAGGLCRQASKEQGGDGHD